MKNDEMKFIIAQYNQINEHLRHHDEAIWKTPAYIIVLGGTTIVASLTMMFEFDVNPLFASIPLFIATYLSWILTYALKKHRYFAIIENQTILNIEKEYGKMMQRTTIPKKIENKTLDETYIFHIIPKKELKKSAHELFISFSSRVTILLLILSILCFYTGIFFGTIDVINFFRYTLKK